MEVNMDKIKKEIIGRIAKDDATWDKCFVDLQSIGIKKTKYGVC